MKGAAFAALLFSVMAMPAQGGHVSGGYGSVNDSTFLFTAEFPYYRIPPSDWAHRLDAVQESGVQVITAYIPWNLHQRFPDGYADFSGTFDARTELSHLIELLKQRKMYLIVKPGPFICAEVQHGGIPDWVTSLHPEVITLDHAGRPVGFRQDGKPLPAYLHPTYVELVKAWYTEVVRQVILPNQAPLGPIVAVQVENEIPYSTSELANPFSWGYNQAEIDLFREWLSSEYQSIETFNVLHGTTFPGFDLVPAPIRFEPGKKEEWLLLQDWARFKGWYGGEVLTTYGEMLRSLGVTVPLYHNQLMLEDEPPSDGVEMARAMPFGPNFWLDRSPLVDFDQYVRARRRLHQAQAAQPGVPLNAPEVNWGWGNEEEYDYLTRLLMPFVSGLNIYPIVDSDQAGRLNGRPYSNNPEPYPGTAAITADGRLRPAYERLRTLTTFANTYGEALVSAAGPAEIGVLLYAPYNLARLYTRWGGVSEQDVLAVLGEAPDQNEELQAVEKRLIAADVEYDVLNLQAARDEDLRRYKVLLGPGYTMMDRASQEKLVRYVEQGGTLIMGPRVPSRNLRFEPEPHLAERLFPGELPGEAAGEVAASSGEGAGKVVLLGIPLAEALADEPFLSGLFTRFGARLRFAWSEHSGASNPDVEVIPRLAGDRIFLFAANRSEKTMPDQVLHYIDSAGTEHTVTADLPARRVQIFVIAGEKVEASF